MQLPPRACRCDFSALKDSAKLRQRWTDSTRAHRQVAFKTARIHAGVRSHPLRLRSGRALARSFASPPAQPQPRTNRWRIEPVEILQNWPYTSRSNSAPRAWLLLARIVRASRTSPTTCRAGGRQALGWARRSRSLRREQLRRRRAGGSRKPRRRLAPRQTGRSCLRPCQSR